jgi:hypothetical protein
VGDLSERYWLVTGLPSRATLKRRWHEWEAGHHLPGDFYQPILARVFGIARYALFPRERHHGCDAELLETTGMDTVAILARMRTSDVDPATLTAVRLTVDRLCSEYPCRPAEQLIVDGRQWLRRVADLRGHRLTLAQHREVLTLAGWLALLVGCAEYDLGDRTAAEGTRNAALTLGHEADSPELVGWASTDLDRLVEMMKRRSVLQLTTKLTAGGALASSGDAVRRRLAELLGRDGVTDADGWEQVVAEYGLSYGTMDPHRVLDALTPIWRWCTT